MGDVNQSGLVVLTSTGMKDPKVSKSGLVVLLGATETNVINSGLVALVDASPATTSHVSQTGTVLLVQKPTEKQRKGVGIEFYEKQLRHVDVTGMFETFKPRDTVGSFTITPTDLDTYSKSSIVILSEDVASYDHVFNWSTRAPETLRVRDERGVRLDAELIKRGYNAVIVVRLNTLYSNEPKYLFVDFEATEATAKPTDGIYSFLFHHSLGIDLVSGDSPIELNGGTSEGSSTFIYAGLRFPYVDTRLSKESYVMSSYARKRATVQAMTLSLYSEASAKRVTLGSDNGTEFSSWSSDYSWLNTGGWSNGRTATTQVHDDGAKRKLYVDGKYISSDTGSHANHTWDKFVVGATEVNNEEWRGDIYDVRVSTQNLALTSPDWLKAEAHIMSDDSLVQGTAPIIEVHPSSNGMNSNNDVVFSAKAINWEEAQWQYTDNGVDWIDIAEETSETLTVNSGIDYGERRYRLQYTSALGDVSNTIPVQVLNKEQFGSLRLLNGDFEESPLVHWTAIENQPLDSSTSPGGSIVAYKGSYFVWGGTTASSRLAQNIALPSFSLTEQTRVKIEWYQASHEMKDYATIGIIARDSEGAILSQQIEGSNRVTTYWTKRSIEYDVPAGASSVDVVLDFTRGTGTNSNGYIDNVSVSAKVSPLEILPLPDDFLDPSTTEPSGWVLNDATIISVWTDNATIYPIYGQSMFSSNSVPVSTATYTLDTSLISGEIDAGEIQFRLRGSATKAYNDADYSKLIYIAKDTGGVEIGRHTSSEFVTTSGTSYAQEFNEIFIIPAGTRSLDVVVQMGRYSGSVVHAQLHLNNGGFEKILHVDEPAPPILKRPIDFIDMDNTDGWDLENAYFVGYSVRSNSSKVLSIYGDYMLCLGEVATSLAQKDFQLSGDLLDKAKTGDYFARFRGSIICDYADGDLGNATIELLDVNDSILDSYSTGNQSPTAGANNRYDWESFIDVHPDTVTVRARIEGARSGGTNLSILVDLDRIVFMHKAVVPITGVTPEFIVVNNYGQDGSSEGSDDITGFKNGSRVIQSAWDFPAYKGDWALWPQVGNKVGRAWQDIVISEISDRSAIDAGSLKFILEWYQNGDVTIWNYGDMQMIALDSNGDFIGTHVLDMIVPIGWTKRMVEWVPPAGTRTIRLAMNAGYQASYFDDITLKTEVLDAPVEVNTVHGDILNGRIFNITGWEPVYGTLEFDEFFGAYTGYSYLTAYINSESYYEVVLPSKHDIGGSTTAELSWYQNKWGGTGEAGMGIIALDDSGIELGRINPVMGTPTSWTNRTASLLVPSGATKLRLVVNFSNATERKVGIDEVTIKFTKE